MKDRTHVDQKEAARFWVPVQARYRSPNLRKSIWAIVTTLIPFFALWVLAWYSLDGPRALTITLALLVGFLLMRVFCLQHDCGHGSLFENRRANTWTGRCLGVLTITPYDVWRKVHASHHQHSGNLDAPNLGQIVTLTLKQYRALSPLRKLSYRIYRHPVSLLLIAPFWLFFLEYRVPSGLMRAGARYWISAMATNLAIATILLAMYSVRGLEPILWIFVPSMYFGAFGGVCAIYMHHQFDQAHFDYDDDWRVHEAALRGSSQLILPAWLQWCTANINIHHIHHLYSRIPFYRLPEVLHDHPELESVNKITF